MKTAKSKKSSLPRPPKGKAKEAWDAGVDYAHDLIAWHPDSNEYSLVSKLMGGVLDLCGGDEYAADWAFDGGKSVIHAHFAAKEALNELG